MLLLAVTHISIHRIVHRIDLQNHLAAASVRG